MKGWATELHLRLCKVDVFSRFLALLLFLLWLSCIILGLGRSGIEKLAFMLEPYLDFTVHCQNRSGRASKIMT